MGNNHKAVIRCCYTGMFVQAMIINLAPLLFVPLIQQMGLTFEQVGRLVLITFLTQMVVDLLCCAVADRVSIKALAVFANLFACAGLWLFALSPGWFANPYDGLILGVIVYSTGCGLLEVLTSPIINAVPSDRKAGDMALLHAWFPIGKVTVILVSGLALRILGASNWRVIMLAWSLVPLVNTAGFLRVTLPPLSAGDGRQTLRTLARMPAYLLIVVALGLAGATEVTLAQWASAFAEVGLGFSKTVADLVGFCLFGVGMIIGRLWFGLRGQDHDLRRLMLAGAALSALMYLLVALAPWPAVSLAACIAAGLFVSMLWPGLVSMAAARFPMAGASMFALLAASGDTGAGVTPWLVGVIADAVAQSPEFWRLLIIGAISAEQVGMRAGLLIAGACPILLVTLVLLMKPDRT